MRVIWETSTEALQIRTGGSVSPIVQKHHVTLISSEAEDTRTEPGPKASSGPIVRGRPGTACLPASGTRLRQQISFNLRSYLQLLDGGVVET